MLNDTVSVVTTVYEKDELCYIKEAFASLQSQVLPIFEIIVVVDGPVSNDVFTYLKSLRSDLFYVHYFEHNQGVGYARNYGVSCVRGNYVAFMDSDDISLPQRINVQLKYLKLNDLDAVSAFMDVFDNSDNVLYTRRLPEKSSDIIKCAPFFCPLHNTALFAKKSVLQRLGYNNNYIVSEDYDLFIRMIKLSYRLGNVPEVLVRYRQPNKSLLKRRGLNYALCDLKVKLSAFELIDSNLYRFIFFPLLLGTFLVRLLPTKIFSLFYMFFNKKKSYF